MVMKIIYSYNKKGDEASYWKDEISRASSAVCEFIPFNHGDYIGPEKYGRAQLLDNLYASENKKLELLYSTIIDLIRSTQADALFVDNANPYHPEFLLTLPIFKVLRASDCALATYDRDIPYIHAFDYILYYTPGYTKDMTMAEKFAYCRAPAFDLLPLGSFSKLCDPSKNSKTIFNEERDIDLIFIGSMHPLKMPLLGKLKKRYKSKFVFRGLSNWKRNMYFNLKHSFPNWITPIEIEDYKNLCQRAKIGINFHIRDWRQVGNYRLYDLPANGVMQISDGGEYLNHFFKVGKEIVTYQNEADICSLIDHYLENHDERQAIALAGFERVKSEYQINTVLAKAATMIKVAKDKKDFFSL